MEGSSCLDLTRRRLAYHVASHAAFPGSWRVPASGGVVGCVDLSRSTKPFMVLLFFVREAS